MPLERINEAFDLHEGESIRTVIAAASPVIRWAATAR
jgi:hypothetical protein